MPVHSQPGNSNLGQTEAIDLASHQAMMHFTNTSSQSDQGNCDLNPPVSTVGNNPPRQRVNGAITEVLQNETLLKTGALQDAILNSANFSSIATDEKGVIQIFNVGAERMLGYEARRS